MSEFDAELLEISVEWMDRWWDPGAGLLWNMDGSFDEIAPPRSIHLVPQSSWYVAGLLQRGAPGDEERAVRTIDAILAVQYDDPGTAWHGTFARFLETPYPKNDAIMWLDYDPNWRQFIGTTFELLLQEGQPGRSLDAAVQARMRAAIALAVAGEPLDRVPPNYSNIALMRAWLEVEHARPGAEEYAARVVALFDENGAFEEYNSATYYGIDLYALALWRDRSSSSVLREAGARIEAALWRDIGRWYHPGLRNLCGPWSRSYGMDLRRYVSLLGVWMWPALGQAATPFPDIAEAQVFDHAHDLSHGPMASMLGPVIPVDVDLAGFGGEHTVEQRITSAATTDRVATGWLSDGVMCGGETGLLGASARGQYHPATVHWARPDGGVGWIRLVHYAPARAVASPGALEITCLPSVKRGPVAPELWVYAPGVDVVGSNWTLPGLDVEVVAEPDQIATDDGISKVQFPVETSDLSLRFGAS